MHKCIFHIPYKLEQDGMAAPMLRPKKMIEGFYNIGYQVDVVAGSALERKEKIKKIKAKILNGEKYDFMYAESSTMPTLLTEKHHFPTHPILDFSFFEFLKKHNIKIGLFYRDIYWKFNAYKTNLPAWKSYFAIKCYKYELRKYEELLDGFYLPSMKVYPYLETNRFDSIVDALPPGCENLKINRTYELRDFNKKPLNIFYVGGLGRQYQISELMKAVQGMELCELVICCRENEWMIEKNHLEKYLSNNICIVHKKNRELEELYSQADICSLMFEADEYRNMAMPYKAFEYLAHEKPSLVTRKTAIGEYIKINDIGWELENSMGAIRKTINDILENPEALCLKINNCIRVKEHNTWEERAKKVMESLHISTF